MRIRLFFLLFIFFSQFSFAQLETKHWFLSNNRISVTPSGVTTGLPLPPPTPGFSIPLRSTSISDANGNLLFASNGNTVIDKNLNRMPSLINVNILAAYNKVLIQQIPSTSKYLLFYTKSNNTPNNVNTSHTLKYALIDLSLNNGNGDVVVYDQIIETNSSPTFTLVEGVQNNPWLVTHKWGTDSFYVYSINSSGINLTPVKSRAGTNYVLADYIFKDLKTSYDGKMIAGVTFRGDYSGPFESTSGFIEVFNFNNANGTLTYKIRTPRGENYGGGLFSLEFSPDNRLLYESISTSVSGLQPCGFGSSTLIQYNLCYTDTTEFNRYKMSVGGVFNLCVPQAIWGNVQMGADKKLRTSYFANTMPTLSFPNVIGTSSSFNLNALTLPNGVNGNIAIPDFPHRQMEKAIKNNITYEGGCHPNPITFKVTNDTIVNINWNFGDPPSPNNTSTLISPTHIFSSPGIYTVTATLRNTQNIVIETITGNIEIKDPTKRLLHQFPLDTALCQGEYLNIGLHVINGIFEWSHRDINGNFYFENVTDSINISNPGRWYVKMRQNDCNGCIMIDSIDVVILPKPNFSLGPDRGYCSTDSLLLQINDPDATFIWSTGSTADSIWVTQPGLYWVEAEYNNNGCPLRDSINITEFPGLVFTLPNDTTLCNNQTLLLNPGVSNSTYLWQNGQTTTQFVVTQPGQYWVEITSQNGCSKRDTINVNYINAQQVYLGADTSLCSGSLLNLNCNISNAQYEWSTGATTQNITVNQSNSYWVKVNNGSCTVSDTIVVSFNTPPIVYLGKDTTICDNKNLLLNAGVNNAQYLWQNGSTLQTFNVIQAGRYWVQVKQNGCTVNDTIDVFTYTTPQINLGVDTSICFGSFLPLNAGNGFSIYNWNNGTNLPINTVNNIGKHWVLAQSIDGCIASDTIELLNIFPLPNIDLGSNSALCIGQSRTLSIGSNFKEYLWSNGSTLPIILITNLGKYWVKVKDINNCSATDTIDIVKYVTAPSNFLPLDSTKCSYNNITISPLQNYTSYMWNTNATTKEISIKQPGLYWLQVKDINDCIGKDSINIYTKDCLRGLYLPNAFTPNNDNKNDIFKPQIFGNLLYYEFYIFDRFGKQVFYSRDINKGWDGKYKGQEQKMGTYAWICKYQIAGQNINEEKGTLILLH